MSRRAETWVSVSLRPLQCGALHSPPFCAWISCTCHTTGYCRNAVVSVCYTIFFDSSGSLVSVSADLVVTDISLSSYNASLFSVAQSYSVSFVSVADVTRTSAAGNLINRTRSGNPGYVTGLPVLGGIEIGSGSSAVISAQRSGMTIPAFTPTGSCTLGLDAVSVEFGVDLRGGCSLLLTRSELQTMCSGSGPYMNGDLPSFWSINTTHVGIFGNADPQDSTQWLALDNVVSAANYLWDDATSTCNDFYATIDYKFLTADVGSTGNPQQKIIAALVGGDGGGAALGLERNDVGCTRVWGVGCRAGCLNEEAYPFRGTRGERSRGGASVRVPLEGGLVGLTSIAS